MEHQNERQEPASREQILEAAEKCLQMAKDMRECTKEMADSLRQMVMTMKSEAIDGEDTVASHDEDLQVLQEMLEKREHDLRMMDEGIQRMAEAQRAAQISG